MKTYKARPDKTQRQLMMLSRLLLAIAVSSAGILGYIAGQPGPMWCIGDGCHPTTVTNEVVVPVPEIPEPRLAQDA